MFQVSRLFAIAVAGTLVLASPVRASAEQTIVFFRHAEKPSSGLGQLTCQGLNRALALPDVLLGRYGTPDYVYAPDPGVKMTDAGASYFYVRPLATLEPTAIRAGRSVNTHYGYSDIAGLQRVLVKSSKASSTIFVAWEHAYLVKVVQSIMKTYGGGAPVPPWKTGDYDTLYVVHLDYTANGITAWLQIDHEGLNGQPGSCR